MILPNIISKVQVIGVHHGKIKIQSYVFFVTLAKGTGTQELTKMEKESLSCEKESPHMWEGKATRVGRVAYPQLRTSA